MESIHKGHRQRMKTRFLREGLDHFDEVQVLELLLFYAIPQRDTNALAHGLINHFGSLSQVLEAVPEETMKVTGMGQNAATLLKLTAAVTKYYSIRKSEAVNILTTTEMCGNYLVPFFGTDRNESAYLLCLDAKCKVLCCRKIGEGSVGSANVSIRKIVEIALGTNARSVVLAHNHPGGLAIPSGEDILTTRRLAAALEMVDVTLADHIVVADDDWVSLAQSGFYRPEEH